MKREETYLGDGLYGSYDGFEVILRASRDEGDHWVSLDPSVFEALKRLVANYERNQAEAAYERSLSDCYRGGEYASALAESQARIQRELK